ncbi:unnamed protein product [Brassica oleracea]
MSRFQIEQVATHKCILSSCDLVEDTGFGNIDQVTAAMGLDYSYMQPSASEDYGLGDSADSGYSQTDAEFEAAILMDQAEIEASRVQYPPQPEVEFGFPRECYCGGEPLLATSVIRNDPGRRYYTCRNVEDGDCHVWKWWDVAVMEEVRSMGTQVCQLSDKVDHLASLSDYESEVNQVRDINYEMVLKLAELEKIVGDLPRTGNRHGFELVVGVMFFVVLIIAMVIMFK